MEIYIRLFEVLFPVFFIVGIGYFLGKKSPNLDTSFITNYAANFGTPALVIFALTSSGVSFSVFAEYFIYSLIAIICFAIIGIIFLVLMKKDYIRELPPFILPNTGNMGIPICLFAYGKLGLAIAAAVTSAIVVFHFSLNILLASRKFSFKPLINCVPIYALIVSLFFVYFKIPSPKFLENATFLISYSTIFLVLMSLGIALSKLKIGGNFISWQVILDSTAGPSRFTGHILENRMEGTAHDMRMSWNALKTGGVEKEKKKPKKKTKL